jgi:hypothetical protein
MAAPVGATADTTRVLSPLERAHKGSALDETVEMPGAVDATTVEPAGSAFASTRINAL